MTTNFTRRRYDIFELTFDSELTEPTLNGLNLTFSCSAIHLSTGLQEELTCEDKFYSVVSNLFNSVQRLPGM